MRILMLGNSFTYFHDMPKILSALLDAEVVAHTRGGAMLAEHLNPETTLGGLTLPALRDQKWDYVIMQEQSNAPIRHPDSFMNSVQALCPLIRASGAQPVLYATWAYRDGSDKLGTMSMSYEAMAQGLYEAYRRAADANDALIADVGSIFTKLRDTVSLYEDDDYHPSAAASVLIAHVLADTIKNKG